ncbi:DNA gyrase subunit B [Streptomyces sp. NPDC003635]
MSEERTGYDASRIHVLEGVEAVRKRPGMYVGSTGERGLYHLAFEVFDWALNEVLAGRGNGVDVVLAADGRVRVTVDGPGAGNIDADGLEALLTRPHTGPWPGGRRYLGGGLFGVGPFVANALSSHLTAEVRRNGVRWARRYERGVDVGPPASEDAPDGPATGSGTTIVFRPDADIFGAGECSYERVESRFRELAFLHPGLAIALTDRRPSGGSRSVRFLFPDGLRDFVACLDPTGTPSDVLAFEGEDPGSGGVVEVALTWSGTPGHRAMSFANSAPTAEGGTHLAGFYDGLAGAVNAFATERQLLTGARPDLGVDRIVEGLTAVVAVTLDHPEYEGATRGRLGDPAVRGWVAQVVREHVGAWLAESPRRAAAVVDRVAVRSPS